MAYGTRKVETIHRGNWHSSSYPIEGGNRLYTFASRYPMEEAAECNGKKRSSLSVAGKILVPKARQYPKMRRNIANGAIDDR